ncbi:ubiquitin fusion degradation protein UFD1-domain-containing protein, partial [Syncephalis fuscata]
KQEAGSPLTFELKNGLTDRVTHAGVREFSAEEGTVQLPAWMFPSLGLNEGDSILVQTKRLPKGSWAQFQPLTDQYRHIRDYRAAFEAHLRSSHTTLTTGETISVPYGAEVYEFKVLALKPADAVTVIDTDLTVVLESPAKLFSDEGGGYLESLKGKEPAIDTYINKTTEPEAAPLVEGVPVKHETPINGRKYYQFLWRKKADISIKLFVHSGDGGKSVILHIYVSLLDKTPNLLDHVWANWEGGNERLLRIDAQDALFVENDTYFIGIHTFGDKAPFVYTLIVEEGKKEEPFKEEEEDKKKETVMPVQDTEQCQRCHAMVPSRTMHLHRNFCERNNIRCEQCGKVTRIGEETDRHWHCSECDKYDDVSLKEKHEATMHCLQYCSCGDVYDSVITLSTHRATNCTQRLISCRYCRNLLPRGKLDTEPRNRIMNLTEHEAYCGGRTIICVQCQMAVRLRDVKVHMQLHTSERERLPPPFKLCRNTNCTRPQLKPNTSHNPLGLCETCFGLFWSPVDDPNSQKLIMRIARRYHLQLIDGCKEDWCHNKYCATGKGNKPLDANTAANTLVPLILPLQALTKKLPLPADICFISV